MKDCPLCGAHSLTTDTRDIPVSYQGRKVVIPSVTGAYCETCGEIIFDIPQGELYFEKIKALMQDAKPTSTYPIDIKLG
jgi:HTH-type transcriptional regulator/antitoxin MqsA